MQSLARWQRKNDNRFTAFDGRLYLERRPTLSPNWYCRCCHKNKQLYKTTKSPMLADAQTFAERWFLDIQSRIRSGEPVAEPTLARAFKSFIEYHEEDLLKAGASSERKIQGYRYTWNNVKDYLGDVRLGDITNKKLEDFRLWRQTRAARALTEKTLHADIGLVRLCLKHAIRQGWIQFLPQFPVEHIKHESPDWFSPREWQKLLKVSRKRIKDANDSGNASEHIKKERQELHAFILLMVHGCIRVDECLSLCWKDLEPEKRNSKLPFRKQTVLIRIAHGKTGARNGIGTFGALRAMEILSEISPDAGAEDKLFTTPHRHGMARLLERAELRKDSKGRLRNAKTLRHTSLMFRFLYEPDIRPHELATIAGTSSTILEQYYLKHITAQMVQDRLTKKALAEL
jgi:integrase